MALQTTQLRAGTPEYNRSWMATTWTQKMQLHRDIQTHRGNVKQKIKKNKDRTMLMVTQVFKDKNVGRLPLYMVTDFLAPVKIPISAPYIEKSKNIENRVDKLHQVRHIFQEWNIRQDPNKQPIEVIHHYLSVVAENRLTNINSQQQTISRYYDNPRTVAISMYSVSDLKKLCRLRYLKVGGNKNALVERLVAEKW